LKAAFLGLVQSGKSTLVSAVSGKEAAPSGAVEAHEVMVSVPDERLDWLTGLYQPKKTVRATVDCVDLPGLSFTDDHGRMRVSVAWAMPTINNYFCRALV